jgi:hypothetical protein
MGFFLWLCHDEDMGAAVPATSLNTHILSSPRDLKK